MDRTSDHSAPTMDESLEIPLNRTTMTCMGSCEHTCCIDPVASSQGPSSRSRPDCVTCEARSMEPGLCAVGLSP